MKRRVERSIGERTTMLNGVSHDLRTILTRFKLSLALMEQVAWEIEALEKDVDEMSRMLEDYLAFARGDAGETRDRDRYPLACWKTLKSDAERQGHQTELTVDRRSARRDSPRRLPPPAHQSRLERRPLSATASRFARPTTRAT